MALKRFLAPTARMAMDAVRRELGDDAVILSNKRIGDQIEILAAPSQAVDAIVEGEIELGAAARTQAVSRRATTQMPAPAQQRSVAAQSRTMAAPQRTAAPSPQPTSQAPRPFTAGREGAAMYASVASEPNSDDEDVRRWTPPQWKGATLKPMAPAPQPRPAQKRGLPAADLAERAPVAARQPAAPEGRVPPPTLDGDALASEGPPAVFRRRPSREHEEMLAAAAPAAPTAPVTTISPIAPLVTSSSAAPTPSSPLADPRLMAELQAMRDAFSQQIAALGSSLASRIATPPAASAAAPASNPTAVAAPDAPALTLNATTGEGPTPSSSATIHVLMRLLTSGFSPSLARYISQRAPQVTDLSLLDGWLQQVLATNIKCVDPAQQLIDAGGAFALTGPTGVGKTTTLAKIAARFAVRHGTSKLGLITLDSYRVGAHEQLRTYARILGAPVQVAHDAATLRETLMAMRDRKLVLIDTCGVSPRDDRVRETLEMLDGARFAGEPVKRLLLLNAGLHVETLDDVAQAWRGGDAAGAVLTKMDEAARCGAVLDCVVRHQLKIVGLTNGQRVPEDWHAAQSALLAHVALKPAHERFGFGSAEAPAFARPAAAAQHA